MTKHTPEPFTLEEGLLLMELARLADEMQSASSAGLPVGPEWLDRRIARIRALLKRIEG